MKKVAISLTDGAYRLIVRRAAQNDYSVEDEVIALMVRGLAAKTERSEEEADSGR